MNRPNPRTKESERVANNKTVGWTECDCVPVGDARIQAELDDVVRMADNPGIRPGQRNSTSVDAAAIRTLTKWRPGRILDPFVGSGTTLAVASGMGRDSVGIDLDPRNAHLAEQRVGMFLDVDWGHYPPTTELPPDIIDVPVEDAL